MLLTTLAAAFLTAVAPAKSSNKHAPSPATNAETVTVQEADSLFYKISVSKGQTLSWIGLRHLGAWTPEIASQVVADNPGLKPDILAEGQNLRLRRSLDRRALAPAQQIALASRKAVVTRTLGQVDFLLADGTTKPLTANQFLSVGDRIRTGKGGVAELVIDNQSILRVRENSQLSITSVQDTEKIAKGHAGTQVSLELGSVWTKVRKWAGPLVGFEVRLPNAIAGVHGTIFECVVRADSTGDVRVYEGVVGVTGRTMTSEVKVARNQSVSAAANGTVSAPKELLPGIQVEPALDPSKESLRDLREDLRQAQLRKVLPYDHSGKVLPAHLQPAPPRRQP
jgi:hypothetical protein